MHALSLHQFAALSEDEKIAHLEEAGVYLEVYKEASGYRIALFSLYSFYAEVWLYKKRDRIDRINTFTSYRRLSHYLDQVNIDPVYQLL